MRAGIALVVAACGSDPTLGIEVVHPDGVAVASTTISVYAQSDELTCNAVEFGDVTTDQLAGALISEETLFANAPTRGSLAGLPRTDPKVIVARGFGNDGNLVAAGCAEFGEVTGSDSVTIDTVVAANVSIAAADPTRMTDKFGIAVTATDPAGKVLDKRPVSWRVYGPAGSTPATTTGVDMLAEPATWQLTTPSCTASGQVTVEPVPPTDIGGYAVQVRVSWAAAPVPQLSSFTPIDTADGAHGFTAPGALDHPCAIGKQTSGTPVVACIDNAGVSLFSASVSNGAAALQPAGSQATVVQPIGVYTLNGGDIIAMNPGGVQFAITGNSTPKPCASCTALDDAVLMPACGSETEKLIVHDKGASPETKSILAIDLQTGTATVLPITLRTGSTASINAVGCATVLDANGGSSSIEQVLVLDDTNILGNVQTHAEFACTGNKCTKLPLPIGGAAVGFATGNEPFMIQTTLDASGVVLESGVIEVDASGGHFVSFSRLPSVSAPHVITIGQLDDDGQPDLVWANAFKKGEVIQVAYARTVDGAPLSALSQGLDLTIDQMLVGDVTGDGKDDVVIAATVLGTRQAAVVPTAVPADNGQISPDTPCSP